MKLNIFLDLDETIIFSDNTNTQFDNLNCFQSFQLHNYKVYKRPHLDDFLKCLNKLNCNISVWSAGDKNYVMSIVKHIFKNFNLKFILTRDQCYECQKETGHLKDFKWLNNKINLNTFGYPILIDDLLENCIPNKEHCINIAPFNLHNPYSINDNELKKVIDILINNYLNIYYF